MRLEMVEPESVFYFRESMKINSISIIKENPRKKCMERIVNVEKKRAEESMAIICLPAFVLVSIIEGYPE